MRFEKHCWAEIDLDALLANYDLIHRNAGGNVCAVLKADAYGHGSVAVAEALHKAGISAFAVSCLAEARHLRRHGLTEPLLILGYTDPAFADELANLDITQALFSPEYARALSQAAAAAGCTVRCHLKADTGMGRIGFNLRTDFEKAMGEMEACYSLPGLAITGIFQHFAVADSLSEDDTAYTENQHELFVRAVERLIEQPFPARHGQGTAVGSAQGQLKHLTAGEFRRPVGAGGGRQRHRLPGEHRAQGVAVHHAARLVGEGQRRPRMHPGIDPQGGGLQVGVDGKLHRLRPLLRLQGMLRGGQVAQIDKTHHSGGQGQQSQSQQFPPCPGWL